MVSFRLGTYNIRKGKGASGRASGAVEVIAQALSQLQPDIMLCQEVFHGRTRALQQSHVLSRTLGLDAFYVPNRARRREHSGNATFSAFALEALVNHDISTNPIEHRGALYSRFVVDARPVHVFNVHLGLYQSQRLQQIRRVVQLVGAVSRPHEAVLIAGDFNDWTGRINRELVQDLGFVNAFAHLHGKDARTYHARRPVFNLDRVYVKNLEVIEGARLIGAPWTDLSDHLPLWTRLRLLDV